MKRIVRVMGLAFLLSVLLPSDALPQAAVAVSGTQTDPASGVFNQTLGVAREFTINNTGAYRTISLWVKYVRNGGGAATSIEMVCRACTRPQLWSSTCTWAASYALQVITATDPATGISTTKSTSFTRPVTATDSWVWGYNVYGSATICQISGTGSNANDVVTVDTSRGTP